MYIRVVRFLYLTIKISSTMFLDRFRLCDSEYMGGFQKICRLHTAHFDFLSMSISKVYRFFAIQIWFCNSKSTLASNKSRHSLQSCDQMWDFGSKFIKIGHVVHELRLFFWKLVFFHNFFFIYFFKTSCRNSPMNAIPSYH